MVRAGSSNTGRLRPTGANRLERRANWAFLDEEAEIAPSHRPTRRAAAPGWEPLISLVLIRSGQVERSLLQRVTIHVLPLTPAPPLSCGRSDTRGRSAAM